MKYEKAGKLGSVSITFSYFILQTSYLLHRVHSHPTRDKMIHATHKPEHELLQRVARDCFIRRQNSALAEHLHQHVPLICHDRLPKSGLLQVLAHRAIGEVIEMAFRHKVKPLRATQLAL